MVSHWAFKPSEVVMRLLVGGLALVIGGLTVPTAFTQTVATRPPVIDVHVHSTNTSPQDAVARNP